MAEQNKLVEVTVRSIRWATCKKYPAEEKVRIGLEGLRGESTIAENPPSKTPRDMLVGVNHPKPGQVTGAMTASFTCDGDGNRLKGVITGGATTTYIGNYFEWKTSINDMIKYYYAGNIRVAM